MACCFCQLFYLEMDFAIFLYGQSFRKYFYMDRKFAKSSMARVCGKYFYTKLANFELTILAIISVSVKDANFNRSQISADFSVLIGLFLILKFIGYKRTNKQTNKSNLYKKWIFRVFGQ